MDGELCPDNEQKADQTHEKPVSRAFREGAKMETATIIFKDGTEIEAEVEEVIVEETVETEIELNLAVVKIRHKITKVNFQ